MKRLRRGLFGTCLGICASGFVPPPASPRKREDLVLPRLLQSGAALALKTAERQVFRAVLFSRVLTLAVGQEASLL